jgi:hypothetical protein
MKNFFSSAIKAGLIVGVLDIIGACLSAYIKGSTTPMQVLRYVGSGAVDPKSVSSPALLALFGLLVHLFIAMSFTFLFFFLVKQMPSLVKYPIPIGILYGIFVWAAMRFVILVNFSRHTQKPIEGTDAIKNAAIAAGILIVCIGIPLAFLARRYVRVKA